MGRTETGRGVVLVVDDDMDVRDALSGILGEAGYDTVTVRDGRMALDYLRSHPAPDALLLDMIMPTMNGPIIPNGTETKISRLLTRLRRSSGSARMEA